MLGFLLICTFRKQKTQGGSMYKLSSTMDLNNINIIIVITNIYIIVIIVMGTTKRIKRLEVPISLLSRSHQTPFLSQNFQFDIIIFSITRTISWSRSLSLEKYSIMWRNFKLNPNAKDFSGNMYIYIYDLGGKLHFLVDVFTPLVRNYKYEVCIILLLLIIILTPRIRYSSPFSAPEKSKANTPSNIQGVMHYHPITLAWVWVSKAQRKKSSRPPARRPGLEGPLYFLLSIICTNIGRRPNSTTFKQSVL